jgi:hypothetical protein
MNACVDYTRPDESWAFDKLAESRFSTSHCFFFNPLTLSLLLGVVDKALIKQEIYVESIVGSYLPGL